MKCAEPTPLELPPERARRRFLATLATAALVYAVAGCLATAPVPRQGWSERKWGPLVPHESFPGDCSLCHVPERWDVLREDFQFDHERETGVALNGAHEQAACLRCHNDRGPVAEFLARGCGGCHVDPHEETLGTDCERCHDERSWRPIGLLAEHATTRFPLTGAHLALPCDQCHRGAHVGDFVGAPIECEFCHQDDVGRALNPDHAALGYTSDCQRCHSPTAWTASHFVHSTFALIGAHRAAACTACHQGGVFAGTPRDCYSCHTDDYANATNPDHVASGFGTSCEQCHSQVAWTPATFDHDPFFPISTGKHSNKACIECHTTGSYATFSCIDCHAHDQIKMDPKHATVPGYVWSSPACYACHPQGKK
jgi:hypothetical protein